MGNENTRPRYNQQPGTQGKELSTIKGISENHIPHLSELSIKPGRGELELDLNPRHLNWCFKVLPTEPSSQSISAISGRLISFSALVVIVDANLGTHPPDHRRNAIRGRNQPPRNSRNAFHLLDSSFGRTWE